MIKSGLVATFLLLTATLLLAANPVSTSTAEPVAKVVIPQMTKQQFLDFREMGFEIAEVKGEQFTIYALPADLQILHTAGIHYTIEQADMASYYAARAPQAMGGFRTYTQIVAFLDSISAANPTICAPKFSIGTSVEGRDQWILKISKNPTVDENEPRVFYNSLIHAREPIGAATLLNLITYLVTHYGTDSVVTNIIDHRELYFLPVVNPDGYAYNETTNPAGGGMWRKNRRLISGSTYGVDLNRNFGFKWGYDSYGSSASASSEVYRGPSAFSEPETNNMRNFVNAKGFSVCQNLHAYASLFLWPWGYDRIYTDKEDFYHNLGDSLAQFTPYVPGIGWTLYPTNGAADDWMWGDTVGHPRVVSVTTEIGLNSDGFWPSVARIAPLIAENVQPNLLLARIADNPYVIGPPQKPEPVLADSVTPNFMLRWSDHDSINTPASYDVYELAGKQTVVDSAEVDRNYWATTRMALSTARAHTGSSSWHSLSENGVQHWLVANTPYLVKPADSLVFWIWYDLESGWDYFYAQLSVDGGFDYVNLSGNFTTNANPNAMNAGNGITGSSGGQWKRAAYDISAYSGKQVLIRLSQFTDGYTLGEGVYLDDIGNIDKFASETLISPSHADTTLSFTNKPIGTYWYRLKATDAQGQKSRYSRLVGTTVYQSFLVGDISGNGAIDVTDLSMLVSYLTSGAPVPNPMGRANINCLGSVDVADLSLLVAYLTGGSSLPNCP